MIPLGCKHVCSFEGTVMKTVAGWLSFFYYLLYLFKGYSVNMMKEYIRVCLKNHKSLFQTYSIVFRKSPKKLTQQTEKGSGGHILE